MPLLEAAGLFFVGSHNFLAIGMFSVFACWCAKNTNTDGTYLLLAAEHIAYKYIHN